MATTLKPCPFCASKSTRVAEFKGIFFVVCDICHADGPVAYEKADAAHQWNTRAKPDGDGNA